MALAVALAHPDANGDANGDGHVDSNGNADVFPDDDGYVFSYDDDSNGDADGVAGSAS